MRACEKSARPTPTQTQHRSPKDIDCADSHGGQKPIKATDTTNKGRLRRFDLRQQFRISQFVFNTIHLRFLLYNFIRDIAIKSLEKSLFSYHLYSDEIILFFCISLMSDRQREVVHFNVVSKI